ncbi:MAG TPA: hypothetical protein VF814_04650 [Casimicrobiaceae bacterium]
MAESKIQRIRNEHLRDDVGGEAPPAAPASASQPKRPAKADKPAIGGAGNGDTH